ncbi:hypothetical protein NB693_24650 [Pantoea ananatis]|uniref:hypothetical protein n=1 Tax=Pantoea ananas TaxID=553 RepID=UPI0022201984|nr:hypothetical protein [Pantoea ananatis]
MEIAGGLLDGRGDRLVARTQAQLQGQIAQGGRLQAVLATVAHLAPAGEVGTVRQAARAAQGFVHQRHRCQRRRIDGGGLRPDGQHGGVLLERAVAHQHAEEETFLVAARAAPLRTGRDC